MLSGELPMEEKLRVGVFLGAHHSVDSMNTQGVVVVKGPLAVISNLVAIIVTGLSIIIYKFIRANACRRTLSVR